MVENRAYSNINLEEKLLTKFKKLREETKNINREKKIKIIRKFLKKFNPKYRCNMGKVSTKDLMVLFIGDDS